MDNNRENKAFRSYQYINTVVNASYVSLPCQLKAPSVELESEVSRYAGNYASRDAGLPEEYCYFSIAEGTPLLAHAKSERKQNCTSFAVLSQCIGWGWDPLLLKDHFDEILKADFFSEEEVDTFANSSNRMVPREAVGSAPGVQQFLPVKVTEEAIRAVLCAVFSRWLLNKPPIRIAVPKTEMEHYGSYVLSAARQIYSYFPVALRARAGFASFLRPGEEKQFPRFSIIFIPESMADAKTLFLDGRNTAAFDLLPKETKRKSLDSLINKLSSLEDPDERKAFIDAIYEKVEKRKNTLTAVEVRNYMAFGDILYLSENKGSFQSRLSDFRTAYDKLSEHLQEDAKELDQTIQALLDPQELEHYAREQYDGEASVEKVFSGVTEKLLPLCKIPELENKAQDKMEPLYKKEDPCQDKRKRCSDLLLNYITKRIKKLDVTAYPGILELLKQKEYRDAWKLSYSAEEYKALRVALGHQICTEITAEGKKALEQMSCDSLSQLAAFQAESDAVLKKANIQLEKYLPKEELEKYRKELQDAQRKKAEEPVNTELNKLRAKPAKLENEIQSRLDELAVLRKQLQPYEFCKPSLEKLSKFRNELQSKLNSSSTRVRGLANLLQSVQNYFEKLELLARTYKEKSSEYTIEDINKVLSEPVLQKARPTGRNKYLAEYRKAKNTELTQSTLLAMDPQVIQWIQADLKVLSADVIELPLSGSRTALLARINDLITLFKDKGNDDEVKLRIRKSTISAEEAGKILDFSLSGSVSEERLLGFCKMLVKENVFTDEDLDSILKMLEACKISAEEILYWLLRTELDVPDEQYQKYFKRAKKENPRLMQELKREINDSAITEEGYQAYKRFAESLLDDKGRKKLAQAKWIKRILLGLGGLLLLAVLFLIFLFVRGGIQTNKENADPRRVEQLSFVQGGWKAVKGVFVEEVHARAVGEGYCGLAGHTLCDGGNHTRKLDCGLFACDTVNHDPTAKSHGRCEHCNTPLCIDTELHEKQTKDGKYVCQEVYAPCGLHCACDGYSHEKMPCGHYACDKAHDPTGSTYEHNRLDCGYFACDVEHMSKAGVEHKALSCGEHYDCAIETEERSTHEMLPCGMHYGCMEEESSPHEEKHECDDHYRCEDGQHNGLRCGFYACDTEHHDPKAVDHENCEFCNKPLCMGSNHGKILNCQFYACQDGHGLAECGCEGHCICDRKDHSTCNTTEAPGAPLFPIEPQYDGAEQIS